MTVEAVLNDKLPGVAGAFSHATVVSGTGRTVYVSGITARDYDGGVVGPCDITAQTETILASLRTILVDLGGSLTDVARLTVYVVDIERDFEAIHAVRRRFFTPPYPASTLVEVRRLVLPEMLIEIEAIAQLPELAP